MNHYLLSKLGDDKNKKFIRTINGKVNYTEIKGGLALPYEHIFQNICDYLVKKRYFKL